MSELTDRLRDETKIGTPGWHVHCTRLMSEAADEIERLEGSVDSLVESVAKAVAQMVYRDEEIEDQRNEIARLDHISDEQVLLIDHLEAKTERLTTALTQIRNQLDRRQRLASMTLGTNTPSDPIRDIAQTALSGSAESEQEAV